MPPKLIWRDNSTPVSEKYDDIYFSSEGAVSETETVFLDITNTKGMPRHSH